MPTYPNPAGGSMEAANDADAASKGWTPAMGSFGINTYPNSGGGSSGGGGGGGGGGGAAPLGGGLAQFAAQTSGVTQAQLAQQKAEFDAQLAFANQQMQQLGIPQLQINQQLAALQQKAFDLQVGQALGTYQGQPTEAAKEFQQSLATTVGQLTGLYNGQPTEAARQFNQNFGLQLAQITGQYGGAPTEAAKEFQQQLAQQAAQFGQTFGIQQGQLTGQYQGAPTEAAKEFLQNLGLQQGQLTGIYNGAPTLAGQLQQAQLSGMYNGAPTEAASEFARQLALQQGQLGQQYLATAAQLQGPQNTFQLSNYLRGAQGNPNVPTYLNSLAGNTGMAAFQAPGSTPPTLQTANGLAGQMAGTQSATPGWDYGQTLGTVQGIANRGAQALAPGALERLTPEELQAFGSGLGAVGSSLPSFLQQYQQSRVAQQAAGTPALA